MNNRRADDPDTFDGTPFRRNEAVPIAPRRRSRDHGLIRYLEDRVSRGAKIAIALGAMLSFAGTVGGALFAFDALYVHKLVYAEGQRQTSIRFDRSDLRGLQQERILVTGQIFTLERQPKLTSAEAVFLNSLKNRQIEIEQDMKTIRLRVDEAEQKGQPR